MKDEKQELIGVLLSISLVAKRLAEKLVNIEKEEVKNERSISKNY
ncbi:hypothetical protein [Clostridium beijerinckii]|nr:hypothetical protein [Clostridium beijerinckii]